MMTRKDYVSTAEILKNFYEHNSVSHIDFIELVHDFSDMFANDNPNFNEFKFQEACGLDIQGVPAPYVHE